MFLQKEKPVKETGEKHHASVPQTISSPPTSPAGAASSLHTQNKKKFLFYSSIPRSVTPC